MRKIVFAAFCIVSAALPAFAAGPPAGPVRIEGYTGDAMEPFVSRDGHFLFFNTRNDGSENVNIHFAEAAGPDFAYRGILQGTASYDLDATPTMGADGRFCFVSPRDYRRSRVSVLCGAFDGKRVNLAEPQSALASEQIGRMIFDVELAADGRWMVFAEGTYSDGDAPDEADLYLATLTPRGFVRSPDGAKILADVNSDELEYAPALSADGLELFFTRVSGIWPFRSPKIFRATRASLDQPFAMPVRLDAIEGFVEGPSLAPDGTLYVHKRVDGHFEIWRMPR